jgi:hypothetical protein
MATSQRRARATALIRTACIARVLRGPVALIIGLALLAGCAPTTRSTELSSAERAAIRVDVQTKHWKIVTSQFPAATRPQVVVAHTAHDGNWQASMVDCLRADGFTVLVDGRYFQFGPTAGRTPEDFAVVTYRCISRYPTAEEVMQFLDSDRLETLFRYYVGTVRPCLLLSGVPSEAPPTWFTFLLSAHARDSWNPYRLAWNSSLLASRIAFIQQLCPPLPGWMDLAQ